VISVDLFEILIMSFTANTAFVQKGDPMPADVYFGSFDWVDLLCPQFFKTAFNSAKSSLKEFDNKSVGSTEIPPFRGIFYLRKAGYPD
jgi:hypothetical protein